MNNVRLYFGVFSRFIKNGSVAEALESKFFWRFWVGKRMICLDHICINHRSFQNVLSNGCRLISREIARILTYKFSNRAPL